MLKQPLVLIASLLCLTGFAANAETFNVGLYKGGSPPLFFDKGDSKTGIYVDILNAIGKESGHTFNYQYYPTKRVMVLFEKGKLDLEPGVNPLWRSNSSVPGEFSAPFAKAEDVVVFPAGKVRQVSGPADISGLKVGTIKGFFYPGFMDAFSAGSIKRADSVDEDQLMKKLANARLDTVFIRKEAALYRIKINPDYAKLAVGNSISSSDISMRLHPSKKSALDSINKAIAKLKQNGEMDKIFAKYQ